MTKSTLLVGARDSQLSLIQAENALQRIKQQTGLHFELRPFSSPGDRDQTTDLRQSPGNFFTKDLDEALIRGDLDAAIHSAKDLPPEGLPPELDWFWLPWREDPRDALVVREGVTEPKVIGISSGRRETWAAERFPKAERRTLRGTIPARLQQLDEGKFDAIVIAAAALHRLNQAHRITEYIALTELTPPPGQGYLAITFRKADAQLRQLRNLYIKSVRFAGAGVGDGELCTLAALREIQAADCIIYDALMDASLLDAANRPNHLVKKIYVGKRSGKHALKQDAITALIGEHVRRGQRVLRLKGGDPGLFGRLTEETDALSADGIPFRVFPGVSALQTATTATGMLLTRRGEARGFQVATPRSTGPEMPQVWFMALGMAAEIAKTYPPETPYAIVYDAGTPAQTIVRGCTGDLATAAPLTIDRPGLLLIGHFTTREFPFNGAFAGRKIWITGSESVAQKARLAVTDHGGIPVVQPLIQFEPTAKVKIRPSKAYNWLVLTSPSAARFFLQQMVSPIQYVPKKIAVTGPATAEAVAFLNTDTVMPETHFTAKGLLATLPDDLSGQKILRIRSEEAGPSLAEALKQRGAKVKDLPIYRTVSCPTANPPPHDVVFLASSSAATAWLASDTDHTKPVIAMGEPTAATLRKRGVEPAVVAPVQTVDEALFAYAVRSLYV